MTEYLVLLERYSVGGRARRKRRVDQHPPVRGTGGSGLIQGADFSRDPLIWHNTQVALGARVPGASP